MKLVIILACLALERYMKIGALLGRAHWFGCYVQTLRKVLPAAGLWRSWQGLAIVVLPIVIVFALVYWVTCSWIYGLFGLVLAFAALLYCLGPDDLYHQATDYIDASDKKDKDREKSLLTALLGHKPPQKISAQHRQASHALLSQANDRLFAVIFWFIILGPVAAILYRMVVATNQYADKHKEYATLKEAAATTQSVLDWLPARMTALVYVLVGNFSHSFSAWMKNALTGLGHNKEMLVEVGSLASDLNKDESKASLDENRNVLAMVDRALITVLVLVAVFTLGAWVA
jgi:membrane protein required for beta-lactamase induction